VKTEPEYWQDWEARLLALLEGSVAAAEAVQVARTPQTVARLCAAVLMAEGAMQALLVEIRTTLAVLDAGEELGEVR